MRNFLSFAVKALVSAILLYFVIDWTNIGTLGQRLSEAKPGWLAVMILVQAFQLVLGAIRWREMVVLCDRALPLVESLRFTAIAAFFNQTLPSSVGGDAARIWLLAHRGAGWAAATYSVIIDRMVGVMVLSLIVVGCLPWTLTLITDPVAQLALLVLGFGSLAAIAAFVALGAVQPKFLNPWTVTRHLVAAAAACARLWRAGRVAIVVVALSVVIHLLTAFAAWCAAKSVAAPFSFSMSLFLVLPVLLVSVVPISIAGWGVRERAMTIAFGYASLSPENGLLVSLLFGFGTFLVGAVCGVIWIMSPRMPSMRTITTETQ